MTKVDNRVEELKEDLATSLAVVDDAIPFEAGVEMDDSTEMRKTALKLMFIELRNPPVTAGQPGPADTENGGGCPRDLA